ncbi:hypothetical protein BO70DRAFT_427121 [Aspergillus heteromorphus CBS 117.55]|uniref:Uncharacterized protein n=1 Tax=Aspergillus heteromorphus CBS 117.55 TaxID=1448321 RepID=A0A317WTR0_9EURO|nr:uncharacterized protein BO70DRAFT_427121 [Aspergillus heteromorphus CBS 117.55]PWY88328.1 hypothetical protein BO70DRAFT_427121 [Aspergillus heteromorphus CBS 117.55]
MLAQLAGSGGKGQPVSNPYPLLNIVDLEDPPENWRLCGKKKTTYLGVLAHRILNWNALLAFHGWGFVYDATYDSVLRIKLEVLFKIFYNQAPGHQPCTMEEMFDFSRDAGPRLLNPEKDIPCLYPISRRYPHPPDPDTALVNDYHRPQMAPSLLPDVYIQQMLLPVNVGGQASDFDPRGIAPDIHTPNGPRKRTATSTVKNSRKGTVKSPPKSPRNKKNEEPSPMHKSTMSPNNDHMMNLTESRITTDALSVIYTKMYGHLTPIAKTQMGSMDVAHNDFGALETRPVTPSTKGPAIPSLSAATKDIMASSFRGHESANAAPRTPPSVTEEVERAVMRVAYADLERHPTASSRNIAMPHFTASSEDTLTRPIISVIPATAEVQFICDPRLYEGLTFSPRLQGYPYRGRGPVWDNFSSAVDCVIVAGRLLDAGSTNIDRNTKEWWKGFTLAERAFIEATDPMSSFWKLVAPFAAVSQGESIDAIRSIWAACTRSFKQFQFSYTEIMNPCRCGNNHAAASEVTRSSVTPNLLPGQIHRVKDMRVLLSLAFNPKVKYPCTQCAAGARYCLRLFKSLPMRLVVELDGHSFVRNHTDDITSEYQDREGYFRQATYRWIGGVYLNDGRMYLCWNNAKRGEHDGKNTLRVYESRTNSGVIFGGLSPANPAERVPEIYWKAQQVPLLFYERVMNPDPLVLDAAQRTIRQMAQEHTTGKLVLQREKGWTPSAPLKGPGEYPWPSMMPGRCFDESCKGTGLAVGPGGQGFKLPPPASSTDPAANKPHPCRETSVLQVKNPNKYCDYDNDDCPEAVSTAPSFNDSHTLAISTPGSRPSFNLSNVNLNLPRNVPGIQRKNSTRRIQKPPRKPRKWT